MCIPGDYGRQNCAGWAAQVSKEGIEGVPPFMRGHAFATAHECF